MISGFTGDVASLVIISTMVLLSVLLDSVQEYRAEQAAEQLKVSVALKEQVLRDGREITIRADQLVLGDVVLLAAGDMVPADGRLLEARDFFVNEGLLTGESYRRKNTWRPKALQMLTWRRLPTQPLWGHPSSAARPSSFYARPATLLSSARSAPLYANTATRRAGARRLRVRNFDRAVDRTPRALRSAGEHVFPSPVTGELPVRSCSRGGSHARALADDRICHPRTRRDAYGQAESDR